MSNNLDPINPIIQNPVNLDAVIQDIQLDLKSNLSWLDNSFGICELATKKISGQVITYPEVFANNERRRYVELFPSVDYGNFSFFVVKDPVNYNDYQIGSSTIKKSASVDLIVWLDFEKINSNNNPDYYYRFHQLILNDLHLVLREHLTVKIHKYYKTFTEVWKDFTLIHTEEVQQYFKQPFAGLRLELEIFYFDNCVNSYNNFSI